MARVASISDIKRGTSGKSNAPREGTELRRIYDRLRAGEVVSLRYYKGAKSQLTDLYGMQLETVNRPDSPIMGSKLVGEWDGLYFVPVERII